MELFTVLEVAKKLKTTKQKVYQLIKMGHIQALKLGDLKITCFELERFIREASGKDYSDLENVIKLVV